MIVWWVHKNDTNRILLHYSADIGASETHEYIEMVCASLYWDHHNFNIRHIIQQKQQQTKEKLQLMRHTHSNCNCVREQLFIQFIFELFFYPSSSIRAITSCQIHMYREYKVYTLNSFKRYTTAFNALFFICSTKIGSMTEISLDFLFILARSIEYIAFLEDNQSFMIYWNLFRANMSLVDFHFIM